MFRMVSITAFLVVFGGICVHCIASAMAKGNRWRPIDILKTLVYLFTLFFLEQKLNLVGVLRRLIYLLALLCFVVLVITGFYPVLVYGEHLSKFLLMLHATFTPVFAACLAVLAVFCADNCRFDKNYWPWLQRVLGREAVNEAGVKKYEPHPSDGLGELLRKICFWLIILLALPVILSIILSMFPFFGTDGQEFLLNLHRYSALLLVLAAIVHTYLVIRTRIEQH
jgi:cytochrome b subunit of formate dehydrogenase